MLRHWDPSLGKRNPASVTAIAAFKGPRGGFVGINFVEVNGGFTDSYNSSQGSYSGQVPGDEGDVCSNHGIIVKAPVNGDAKPGTGHSVDFQGDGSVTGSTDPHAPRTYPRAEAGDADWQNNNNEIPAEYWNTGKLQISNGAVVNFPRGVSYTSSLTINGQLSIQGPTTIYVETSASVAGNGIVNALANPADLKIVLLTQSVRNATFGGQSNLYATIYGPKADVEISGDAGFYGAVIAHGIKLSNSGGTHYDKNLKTDNYFADGVKLVQ